MRTAGTPDVLEYRRRLAVQRVGEGCSTEEVAEFLGVDPRSVRRWVAAFGDQGPGGIKARPVPGRPPKLTPAQEKIALRWLADNPSEHGFPTELWTAGRLAQLIEQEWGVEFNEHYLCDWLRQRGYTPQKPRRVPRERDDEAIALWLAVDWPRIKKKARRRGAYLMLLDESGLLMAPLLRRSWSLRGHPQQVKYKAAHREKVSVAAALYLTPLRDRLSLAYQTLVNGYFSNEQVAEFLSGAVQWLDAPIVLIWDQGTMHKGDPIRALVAESGGAAGPRAAAGARLDADAGRVPVAVPEVRPVVQLPASGRCPPQPGHRPRTGAPP